MSSSPAFPETPRAGSNVSFSKLSVNEIDFAPRLRMERSRSPSVTEPLMYAVPETASISKLKVFDGRCFERTQREGMVSTTSSREAMSYSLNCGKVIVSVVFASDRTAMSRLKLG